MIECTDDFFIDLASPNSTHATPKFFDNDKMPFIARTDKCYMYLTLFVQNLLCWSRKKKLKFTWFEKNLLTPWGNP